MGLGMQIVYIGLPGSSELEAQAGLQLLRLGRFDAMVSECRLVMELLSSPEQAPWYSAQLELFSSGRGLDCVYRREDADLNAAVRAAFDAAEQELGATAKRIAYRNAQ